MAQLKNLLVLGSARFTNLIKGIIERAQNGCFYCTCATAAGTAAKDVTTADSGFALKEGVVIGVKFTNTNTASNVTLNVNDTGAKSIYFDNYVYTGSEARICGYSNRITYYMYDGTNWVFVNYSGNYIDNNAYPSAYCSTGAATAAKAATCTNYILKANSYLHITVVYANTAASALTLNVNSKGAKPIYINGSASSATNYTLPAGTYICFYDGTNYYFRNDAVLPGEIEKAANVTGTVAIANGGTGATTAANARTNLGLGNVENKSSATIRDEITSDNVTDALGYTPPLSPFYREATPKATKTYTGVIATDTTAALSNFYAVKVIPTNYNNSWSILIHIKATITGVNEANGLGFQESYFYVEGMRNTYATYYVWNNIRNTSYRPYYYHEAYWAKSAGVTNQYGHLLGVGLRSAWNPTTTNNSRTFTFDILDYSNCTVGFLDSMVVYASVPGTGSTNYQGNTEFNGATQGFTRSGSDSNTYDRTYLYGATIKAKTAITKANLIVAESDGYYKHLKSGTAFDTTYPILYANADVAEDANTNSSAYFSIPFTITTTQAITLETQKPVFVKGTLVGTMFTPVSTSPLTQTIPSSEDGYDYIYLGHAYAATTMHLAYEHPIFSFRNGLWRQVTDETSGKIGSAGSEGNPVYFYNGAPVAGAFTWGVDSETRVQVGWDGDAPEIEIPTSSALPIAQGGTGATTAAAARTNLGLGSAATYNVVSSINDDSNLVTGAAIKAYYEAVGIPSAISTTSAATAAKVATCSSYALLANSYVQVILANANTASSALTLNINGKGAKTIYINGAVSSSSNKTLPAGSYFVFYDGTNYYFRTDGKITGDITGNAASLSSTLPATKGGTGQTSLQAARNAMGLGNTTGALPVANGGTGATTAANARTNLELNNLYQIKSYTYSYTITASGIVAITAANLGIAAITNYAPAGIVSYDTGNDSVVCRGAYGDITSGTVLNLKNLTASSVSATATVKLLFIRSNVKLS